MRSKPMWERHDRAATNDTAHGLWPILSGWQSFLRRHVEIHFKRHVIALHRQPLQFLGGILQLLQHLLVRVFIGGMDRHLMAGGAALKLDAHLERYGAASKNSFGLRPEFLDKRPELLGRGPFL